MAARGERGRTSADDTLGQLYAAEWVGMVRLAYLLVRDLARAEDVAQAAFVAAYPRLRALSESGTARAYLRRSVVNGCRSAGRRRAVEDRYLETVPPMDVVESVETSALRRADAAEILEAVHALPERQREVMVLRYYADLPEQQIADALGISTGSVKTHAHRALETLRTRLGGGS